MSWMHAGETDGGGFISQSPLRFFFPQQDERPGRAATTAKIAKQHIQFSGMTAGGNRFTGMPAKISKSVCVYLSGLRPGFGGRGLLKSSRLTPYSAALSPAPRTRGRAQNRSHRTERGGERGEARRRTGIQKGGKGLGEGACVCGRGGGGGRQDEWKAER